MRLINAIKRFFGLEEYEASPAESQPLEPRRLKAIYMGTEKIWDRDETKPVRYGRWVKKWHDNSLIGHEYEECPDCGCIISDTEKFWDCNYYPNCGTRMDGESE